MSDFFAMGSYGFYVWTAYGVTALVVVLEICSLRARRHAAIEEAQLAGPETRQMASLEPAGEPK
jgi:heme exporter protein CcmD